MGTQRAYISGALTDLPDLTEGRALYERIGDVCRESGLDTYIPHLQTDPEHHPDLSADEVFKRDVAAIASSSVVIAWLGTPSLGVGAEVALATAADKKVLGVADKGAQVSRFMLGLLRSSGMPIVRVSDRETLPELVDAVTKIVDDRTKERDASAG